MTTITHLEPATNNCPDCGAIISVYQARCWVCHQKVLGVLASRRTFAEHFLAQAEDHVNKGYIFAIGTLELERIKREFENGIRTK